MNMNRGYNQKKFPDESVPPKGRRVRTAITKSVLWLRPVCAYIVVRPVCCFTVVDWSWTSDGLVVDYCLCLDTMLILYNCTSCAFFVLFVPPTAVFRTFFFSLPTRIPVSKSLSRLFPPPHATVPPSFLYFYRENGAALSPMLPSSAGADCCIHARQAFRSRFG